MRVNTWLTRQAVEHIASMRPQDRRKALNELLGAFPPEWIDEAIEIAQEYQRRRGATDSISKTAPSASAYRVQL